MKDLLGSFGTVLGERLVNPFTASFLLSWPLWNFKFFLVFFSDADVVLKLKLLSTVVYPTPYDALFLGFLGPALTAFFYVFMYPVPTHWVMNFSLRQKKKLNQLRQSIDDETPLTLEESREIRRRYKEGIKILEDDAEAKLQQIKELRGELAAAESQIAQLKVENNNLFSANSDAEDKVSNLLGSLAQKNIEFDDLSKAARALGSKLEQLQEEADNCNATIEGLKQERDTLKGALHSLREGHSLLNAKVKEKELELVDSRALISSIQSRTSDLMELSESYDEKINYFKGLLAYISTSENVSEDIRHDVQNALNKLSNQHLGDN
jgi:chromosome segregation ATPase